MGRGGVARGVEEWGEGGAAEGCRARVVERLARWGNDGADASYSEGLCAGSADWSPLSLSHVWGGMRVGRASGVAAARRWGWRGGTQERSRNGGMLWSFGDADGASGRVCRGVVAGLLEGLRSEMRVGLPRGVARGSSRGWQGGAMMGLMLVTQRASALGLPTGRRSA